MSEVLNGVYISYHPNGNIREKGMYIDGQLQGVFQEFDEDGMLIIQSHWKDHKLHGKFTHWRNISTGILYETAMYSNDIKIYSTTFDSLSRIAGNYYYSHDGKCVQSVEYKRLSNGYTIVATTTSSPQSYIEELVM